MSLRPRQSTLRLRSRALVAGAGSTVALVGAVAAVALVGTGLVAFDAWPSPERGTSAPLSLAPVGPSAPGVVADLGAPPTGTVTAAIPAEGRATPGAAPSERADGDGPVRDTRGGVGPADAGAPLSSPAGPLPAATRAPDLVGPATGPQLGDAVQETGETLGPALGQPVGPLLQAATAQTAALARDVGAALGAALQPPPG